MLGEKSGWSKEWQRQYDQAEIDLLFCRVFWYALCEQRQQRRRRRGWRRREGGDKDKEKRGRRGRLSGMCLCFGRLAARRGCVN